jgi:hypothetical protein|tara:strand:+ start:300 stop:467 length:168 start_codon:yes stop_codon:yes gene_type:complete
LAFFILAMTTKKEMARSDFGLKWKKIRMEESKRVFALWQLEVMKEERKKLKFSVD